MSDSSTASSVTRVSRSSPSSRPNTDRDDFYLRYLVAHQKQWLEFELLPSGKLRYANNSNFARDAGMIRREVYLGPAVLEEFQRLIRSSGIVHVNDSSWPSLQGCSDRQEIECKLGSLHIAFASTELKTLGDIQASADPAGLTTFYFLSQDLKSFFHMLIAAHFKSRPFG